MCRSGVCQGGGKCLCLSKCAFVCTHACARLTRRDDATVCARRLLYDFLVSRSDMRGGARAMVAYARRLRAEGPPGPATVAEALAAYGECLLCTLLAHVPAHLLLKNATASPLLGPSWCTCSPCFSCYSCRPCCSCCSYCRCCSYCCGRGCHTCCCCCPWACDRMLRPPTINPSLCCGHTVPAAAAPAAPAAPAPAPACNKKAQNQRMTVCIWFSGCSRGRDGCR